MAKYTGWTAPNTYKGLPLAAQYFKSYGQAISEEWEKAFQIALKQADNSLLKDDLAASRKRIGDLEKAKRDLMKDKLRRESVERTSASKAKEEAKTAKSIEWMRLSTSFEKDMTQGQRKAYDKKLDALDEANKWADEQREDSKLSQKIVGVGRQYGQEAANRVDRTGASERDQKDIYLGYAKAIMKAGTDKEKQLRLAGLVQFAESVGHQTGADAVRSTLLGGVSAEDIIESHTLTESQIQAEVDKRMEPYGSVYGPDADRIQRRAQAWEDDAAKREKTKSGFEYEETSESEHISPDEALVLTGVKPKQGMTEEGARAYAAGTATPSYNQQIAAIEAELLAEKKRYADARKGYGAASQTGAATDMLQQYMTSPWWKGPQPTTPAGKEQEDFLSLILSYPKEQRDAVLEDVERSGSVKAYLKGVKRGELGVFDPSDPSMVSPEEYAQGLPGDFLLENYIDRLVKAEGARGTAWISDVHKMARDGKFMKAYGSESADLALNPFIVEAEKLFKEPAVTHSAYRVVKLPSGYVVREHLDGTIKIMSKPEAEGTVAAGGEDADKDQQKLLSEEIAANQKPLTMYSITGIDNSRYASKATGSKGKDIIKGKYLDEKTGSLLVAAQQNLPNDAHYNEVHGEMIDSAIDSDQPDRIIKSIGDFASETDGDLTGDWGSKTTRMWDRAAAAGDLDGLLRDADRMVQGAFDEMVLDRERKEREIRLPDRQRGPGHPELKIDRPEGGAAADLAEINSEIKKLEGYKSQMKAGDPNIAKINKALEVLQEQKQAVEVYADMPLSNDQKKALAYDEYKKLEVRANRLLEIPERTEEQQKELAGLSRVMQMLDDEYGIYAHEGEAMRMEYEAAVERREELLDKGIPQLTPGEQRDLDLLTTFINETRPKLSGVEVYGNEDVSSIGIEFEDTKVASGLDDEEREAMLNIVALSNKEPKTHAALSLIIKKGMSGEKIADPRILKGIKMLESRYGSIEAASILFETAAEYKEEQGKIARRRLDEGLTTRPPEQDRLDEIEQEILEIHQNMDPKDWYDISIGREGGDSVEAAFRTHPALQKIAALEAERDELKTYLSVEGGETDYARKGGATPRGISRAKKELEALKGTYQADLAELQKQESLMTAAHDAAAAEDEKILKELEADFAASITDSGIAAAYETLKTETEDETSSEYLKALQTVGQFEKESDELMKLRWHRGESGVRATQREEELSKLQAEIAEYTSGEGARIQAGKDRIEAMEEMLQEAEAPPSKTDKALGRDISPGPAKGYLEGGFTPDNPDTPEVESLSDTSHLSALYGDLDRRLKEAMKKGDQHEVQAIFAEAEALEEQVEELIAKPSREQRP